MLKQKARHFKFLKCSNLDLSFLTRITKSDKGKIILLQLRFSFALHACTQDKP